MFVRLCFAFAIICNFHFVSAFIYGTRDVVTSLSPFADSNLTQWQAQRLIYDFLLIEEPGQRDVFSPGLAKSWKISENQKIFDFELRDAFWSDNTRVTSEDVKFSLEHILDDHYKSSWKNSFTLLEKIEIISPTKIRIFAKKVNFEFWKNLAVVLKIIPKRFYLDPKSKLYNKQALGSGPYKIVLLNPSQKNILLEKNKTWWGWTDPRLKSWYKADQITFQSVGNDVVARNYFQKNLIDIYPLTNSFLFQELTLSKKYLVYLISDPNQQSKNLDQIFFNLKNSLFNDKKIREALNQLFDRKTSCPTTVYIYYRMQTQ